LVCGAVGAWYSRPLQRNLSSHYAIFRKPWLSFSVQAFFFTCAMYGGMQLPAKVFPKFTPSKFEGVSHSYYTSSQDIVSKFRLFENMDVKDSHNDIASYLSVYSTQPLTKNEMMDNIALHALKEFDLGKMFQVKRSGKDRDPMFWSFGKIHGLENIAFADPQEIKQTNGNPVKIQKIVDRYEGNPSTINSYEHLMEELQNALREYREKVDGIEMNPSDKKKVLSLPFFLAKRQQLPEPRRGQAEFDLFTKLTGTNWYTDSTTVIDQETKITEFDYENFFDQQLLTKNATDSKEFKRLIKVLNLFTKTQHEKL
jgi:hypothetical protein